MLHAQQSILDLVNQTNLTNLTNTVKDLSGEQATTVYGTPTTITHRVSNSGNNVAADYIKEQLEATGLTVTQHDYDTNGRNIYATQTGVTNPNDIYIIGAHYDSVNLYCADDNASGTAAVLELARMLAPICTENTIVYALWDEEEIGLRGSAAHAQQAAGNGDNILGVFNIDMMAFDGDDDNDFDIDVRNIANSVAMKDQIVSVLNNATYGFTLNVNVVNPGTSASDHASFWNQGFSALLFGESWANNDQTTGYHSSSDRDNLFNWPYYHEMSKLVVASMATFASPIFIDNSVTQDATSLTATETGATYQWVDCNNANAPIAGATSQSYVPVSSGNYAVQITKNNCTKVSDCSNFTVLSAEDYELQAINVFPNPVKDEIEIVGLETLSGEKIVVSISFVTGQQILKKEISSQTNKLNVKQLAIGTYVLQIILDNGKEKMVKFIKE